MKRCLLPFALACALISSCNTQSPTETESGGIVVVSQKNGPRLGYCKESGVGIITKGRHAFKDLNRNGELDPYEDWRLSPEKRTEDLLMQLEIEEMAGLMLCSHMQNLPGTDINHYGGKIFTESDANPYDLTDEQLVFLKKDHCKSVLLARADRLSDIVKWNNNVQRYVEGTDHGIPVILLSDPRNSASSDMIFEAGCGGEISRWPNSIGLAATFDPELVKQFGRISAQEYRALGITTSLHPQVDVPTDPRYWRYDGTFGDNVALTTDMARAYCDGMQTSPKGKRISGVWGYGSVNAMAKHWYGYGAQEGGRDSHFAFGEYAVYPGGNLAMHMLPFSEGAMKLEDGTGSVSAVMSTYSLLWDQDPSGENVAVSFSDYFIGKQLRGDCGFDGVVCTDWDVTFDCTGMDGLGKGKPWGVEDLSVGERHFRVLKSGADQFGGCNDIEPVLEACGIWAEKYGEGAAMERFQASARRILLNMFRVGAFENPYLDFDESRAVAGCAEFMEAGYQAQLKSVVMLKNAGGVLPVKERLKVWFPVKHYPYVPGLWGGFTPERYAYPADTALVSKFFELVDSPEEADFALVMIDGPDSGVGYDEADRAKGGNGYVPVSLQYEDYTAEMAREHSIAGGNPLEETADRSYKGKTVSTRNRNDMVCVQKTRAALGNKPLVLVVKSGRPLVFSEIEPYADAILLNCGVQAQAILDLIGGKAEPSGLLPMQMPADMATVETQQEDVPFDVKCYTDSEGHCYDYAFGMNWSGVISDARTAKYAR